MSNNDKPKASQVDSQAQGTGKAKEAGDQPQCKNKKQAKLVCLNPSCMEHAFFCTSCDNNECEVIHQHGDKLLSVSFKEYIRKVLNVNLVDESLEEALNRYRSCLEKLRKDIDEFISKQFAELEQIRIKSTQMGQEEERIKAKLLKKQYQGIKGKELDDLWRKTMEFNNKERNKETIEYLLIKEEEIKEISENFEKVNNMEISDNFEGEQQRDRKAPLKQEPRNEKQKSNAKPQQKPPAEKQPKQAQNNPKEANNSKPK